MKNETVTSCTVLLSNGGSVKLTVIADMERLTSKERTWIAYLLHQMADRLRLEAEEIEDMNLVEITA